MTATRRSRTDGRLPLRTLPMAALFLIHVATGAAQIVDLRPHRPPTTKAQPKSGAVSLLSAYIDGKVDAEFRSVGGSSGDVILLVIRKLPEAKAETLAVSVPKGLRLLSSSTSRQDMVVAGVQGKSIDARRYEPTRTIMLMDNRPVTYVLEAYCAESDKDNPARGSSFEMNEEIDPVLACIVDQGRRKGLTAAAKQAAVWIYTDQITFDTMNRRLRVNSREWSLAEAVVETCVR